MDNKERARKLADDILQGHDEFDVHETATLIAAAFAEVERIAVRKDATVAIPNPSESTPEYWRGVRDIRAAIRALSPEPAASVTHSASRNISEKLSDVCSCGAEAAAPVAGSTGSRPALESMSLPCPFCGGPATVAEYGDGQHIVFCGGCDCHLNPEETIADAITAWNRRSGSADPTKALVAMLKEAAGQFDFYADQHLAKTPPDTNKAETNRVFAIRCRAALRLAEAGG